MFAGLLLVTSLAASNPPDSAAIDSLPQAALVDTGKVMPSPRRPVGMGIQRHRDSLAPSLRPSPTSASPATGTIGLQFMDGWVGLRALLGSTAENGLSVALGVDLQDDIAHESHDITYSSRIQSKGYRFSFALEPSCSIHPNVSLYIDLGFAYEWQSTHTTSKRIGIYGSEQSSSISDVSNGFSANLGLGAKIHLFPRIDLVGGLQFGPSWMNTSTHASDSAQNLSGNHFQMNTPRWVVGLDWQFSTSSAEENHSVKK